MKLQEHKQRIQDFADKWGLEFLEEGECGFGRKCVGLAKGDRYIDYNPYDNSTFDFIDEYYSEDLVDMAAPDAYHKHPCLAVLGRGEAAIVQLSEWVQKLVEENAEVVRYDTGARGIQAMVTGSHGYTVKLP